MPITIETVDEDHVVRVEADGQGERCAIVGFTGSSLCTQATPESEDAWVVAGHETRCFRGHGDRRADAPPATEPDVGEAPSHATEPGLAPDVGA